MREVDPKITLLATGASPDEVTVTGMSAKITGKVLMEFGSAADWDGGLFANCLENFDVLSEHFYSYEGQRYDLTQGKRVDVTESLIDSVRRPANRVRSKAEAFEEYIKRFPALKAKPVPMAIDEWAYSRSPNNLKLALAHALAFQEMFRHTDLIKMAGHTMGTSSIDYTATDAALNATGLLFKFYRDHFGTVPVEVSGNSPQPAPQYPVGGDQPKVNSGSPTYPLDVSAAWGADGKVLTVAVVNPTESARELEISLKGATLSGKGRMWRMTGPSLTAMTGLGRQQIQLTEAAVTEVPKVLKAAPISIDIYEFEKQ
jgi:alpha-L-arabinofuranosidase